jgi:hypothetical protein
MAFDNILEMQIQVKYQQPERRTICPVDAFPLEDTERGLHCKNCGWRELPEYKYVPRTPENPQS